MIVLIICTVLKILAIVVPLLISVAYFTIAERKIMGIIQRRKGPNVIGFLGETKGGEPVPLRISEVNRMLGKVDELALSTEHISIPFSQGENVKVIDGPFNGFNGVIEKVNEEKRKLEVMVKIFGRKTPLELSYMQVEKL